MRTVINRMTAAEYQKYLLTGKLSTSQTKSKYRNQKTELDGVTYDSKKEARRAAELNLMLKNGEIVTLARQVRFRLVKGVEYVADFAYTTKDGAQIIEDVKGMKTAAYKIKKKLLKEMHGIEIVET